MLIERRARDSAPLVASLERGDGTEQRASRACLRTRSSRPLSCPWALSSAGAYGRKPGPQASRVGAVRRRRRRWCRCRRGGLRHPRRHVHGQLPSGPGSRRTRRVRGAARRARALACPGSGVLSRGRSGTSSSFASDSRVRRKVGVRDFRERGRPGRLGCGPIPRGAVRRLLRPAGRRGDPRARALSIAAFVAVARLLLRRAAGARR